MIEQVIRNIEGVNISNKRNLQWLMNQEKEIWKEFIDQEIGNLERVNISNQ